MDEKALTALFSLFDEVSDGVCLADARGRVVYMNPAAMALLEVAGPQASLENICDALCRHMKDMPGQGCPLKEAVWSSRAVTYVSRHGPRSAYSWRDDRVEKSERWKDLRVRCLRTRLPGEAGGEELHVVLVEDATAEMELRRHRADWRSMIAHDLRSPLTSIYASLRLLMELHPEGAAASDDSAKLVDVSYRSCRRMVELLDLYLDVARFDADAMPAHLEDVELSGVVAEQAEEQAALARERRVTVVQAVPEGTVARADRQLLKRVVENLLNNAIKYNVSGGRVELGASSRDGEAVLSCRDTGRGIEAQDLPFIFDRFYQAEARRAGRIQGNGLGLTFCKEAAALMGGSISVESRPGEGTTFEVVLKAAAKP